MPRAIPRGSSLSQVRFLFHMIFSDILTPDRTVAQVPARSKKRALETISGLLASGTQSKPGATEIFDSLIARERLGTTAINNGVAIPHGRMKNGTTTIAAFVQLKEGIDCDAMDRETVRLLFAILVPEHSTEEHLQLLARLAEMFSDEGLRQQLLTARDSQMLYQLLIDWDKNH